MKIGIFIDNFLEAQKYKDPGVIATSLFELGHEIKIYTLNTDNEKFAGLEVKKITKSESESKTFWQKEEVETVIVYSWLSLRFSKLILALKAADKKIILKLDSNGLLLSPLKPDYLWKFRKNNSLKQIIVSLIRRLQWSLFSNITNQKKIQQLSWCDAAIIESPVALDKLEYSLNFQNHRELTSKIVFIPDPVNPSLLKQANGNHPKENIIICIGRWNDQQKNRNGLISALEKIDLKDWKLIIIGQESLEIKKQLLKSKSALDIETFDNMSHDLVGAYLCRSKIFFAPSNFESFNLAAAEALCYGCSLAGTPLESFYYFTNNNQFGTLAKDFEVTEIAKALISEMAKWNNKRYNPLEISDYWCQELSPDNIGKQINSLIKKI